MSKERELLKRIANYGDAISPHFIYEINELLAQPEQEQEPVGYLYKQMDCTGEWATIFKVDKPYITWHDIKDIVPVYTAPPKREPLSEKEIDVLAEANITDEGIAGYYLGFRDAEKHHGIGGGE